MVSGDACNRNQFMGNRPSSRVLAQPGGNSSFSLAWGQPETKEPMAQRAPMQPEPVPAYMNQENQRPVDTNVVPADMAQKPAGAGPVSSNAWASNASQNTGNMISDRPSTRIHAPPGGKSSIVF